MTKTKLNRFAMSTDTDLRAMRRQHLQLAKEWRSGKHPLAKETKRGAIYAQREEESAREIQAELDRRARLAAHNDGYSAGTRGKQITSNPFFPGTLSECWRKGWMDAQDLGDDPLGDWHGRNE